MSKRIFSAFAIAGLFLAFTACNKSSSTNGGSETEGNWIGKGTFAGNARSYAVSFVIGDTAYVGTGNSGQSGIYRQQFSDFFKFTISADGSTFGWTQRASMPDTGRSMAAAFAIGNIGYVGTGLVKYNSTYLTSFYSFDATSNTWSQKADFPGAPRGQAVGFALKGKGYIGTGVDGSGQPYGDFWEFTPGATSSALGSWVQIANYPGQKRYGAVAFTSNDTAAYVVTGNASTGGVSYDFYRYDGSSWKALREIRNKNTDESYDDDYSDIARYGGVSFVIGDYAYVTTGSGNQKTWAYHIPLDLWERRTPYQQSTRVGAVGFTVNGIGLVGTGLYGSTNTDNFSQFDPSASYDSNSDN